MKDTRHTPIDSLLIAIAVALALVALVAITVAASNSSEIPGHIDGGQSVTLGGKVGLALPQTANGPASSGPTRPNSILALLYAPTDLAPGNKTIGTEGANVPAMRSNIDLTALAVPQAGSTALTFSPSGAMVAAFDMDWGDVDRDGDLDLALGSPDGTAVYINNGRGELNERWHNSVYALGVRWADVDPSDANLELVAVGDSTDATSTGRGRIYIYLNPESGSPAIQSLQPGFQAPQLLRIAPGDYDGDGDVDFVVSTNALTASCPVLLCRNDGSRQFDCNTCVSRQATASLSAADFNHDTFLDLALGLYESKEIKIVVNDSGTLSENANAILVASSLAHIPYDLSWGDYDGDGWLDLAAAFPLEQEVRVYRNERGAFSPSALPLAVQTDSFLSPLAVDWADFTGDGRLELAVADSPPRVYRYDDGAGFIRIIGLTGVSGRIQGIRGIELDGDGDLDLAIANLYTAGRTFKADASLLNSDLTAIGTDDVQDTAWGDYNADGWLDLAVANGAQGSRIYRNNKDNTFTSIWSTSSETLDLAWGDYDGDGWLDLATAHGAQGSKIQRNNHDSTFSAAWSSPPGDARSVAWGDYDDDACLDLTVANGAQGVWVYRNNRDNDGCRGDFDPLKIAAVGDARRVAWGDYDRDHHLDLAVANSAQGAWVYHNSRNGTFSLAWTSAGGECRSIAWGDYNGDGWLDLAAANGAQGLRVYRNNRNNAGDAFSTAWSSDTGDASDVAWGDYNGDGRLDLATANGAQGARVYRNSDGILNTVPVWSDDAGDAQSVTWADKDHDGDLDLAIDRQEGQGVDIVENNYVLPAHLSRRYVPLPRNPSYAAVGRPGETDAADFLSAPEILAGRDTTGAVSVPYTLFDPDNGRTAITQAQPMYEFSLDGGGTWHPAMRASGSVEPTGDATRQGKEKVFVWDARGDGAVSDNARFRITIVDRAPTGPVPRASISAVSAPFRVRALTCTWPDGPSISILDPEPPNNPQIGDLVRFLGLVDAGDGTLIFDWDFGDPYDPITKTAQLVHHRFTQAGAYTVTMSVKGQPCPATRQIVTSKVVTVEATMLSGLVGGPTHLLNTYLPFALGSDADVPGSNVAPPAQVADVQGEIQPTVGFTDLTWVPAQASDPVLGYRIYRGTQGAPTGTFRLLGAVPADRHTYTDQTAVCGEMYYVTAFNAGGESPVSMASYFSPRCR